MVRDEEAQESKTGFCPKNKGLFQNGNKQVKACCRKSEVGFMMG
jgi:hypothetical protein